MAWRCRQTTRVLGPTAALPRTARATRSQRQFLPPTGQVPVTNSGRPTKKRATTYLKTWTCSTGAAPTNGCSVARPACGGSTFPGGPARTRRTCTSERGQAVCCAATSAATGAGPSACAATGAGPSACAMLTFPLSVCLRVGARGASVECA